MISNSRSWIGNGEQLLQEVVYRSHRPAGHHHGMALHEVAVVDARIQVHILDAAVRKSACKEGF